MPSVPIVDSHVLIWDPVRFKLPWLDTDYWADPEAVLGRPYGPAEFDQDTSGIAVEALVCLEVGTAPAYGLLEAQWLDSLARQDSRIRAVVAWAPMEYGEQARAYLEAVRSIGPRIKGVRRVLELEPDDFSLQPGFVRATQMLPAYGLSFDLAIKRLQLRNGIELVRRCPETSFVLNHLGKPGIKSRLRDPWWGEIAELASMQNVVCKVSGVITEGDVKHWGYDDVAPYLERVLEVFGEDRILFGGDWPVVLLAASYRRWLETAERVVSGLSSQGQAKFWADNARRFYRLAE
jgi:predicted TIM-barrel fold metal-dependent hydrolase